MRVLRGVIVVATVLVAVIVIGGWALGSTWRVERSVWVRASPEQVHAVVSDLATWRLWAAGPSGSDPACAWHVEGAAGTVGASVRWQGASCGEGRIVVMDSSTGRGIWLDDYVGAVGDASGAGSQHKTGSERLLITSEQGRTRVVWTQEGAVEVIAGAWLMRFLEARIGAYMEQSLAQLARLVETRHDQAASPASTVPVPTVPVPTVPVPTVPVPTVPVPTVPVPTVPVSTVPSPSGTPTTSVTEER